MATSEKDKERKTFYVSPEKFAKDLDLTLVYAPERDLCFRSTATNRPGMLFAGFDEFFPAHRIQALGNAEMAYLNSLGEKFREMQLDRLCLLYTSDAADE